MLSTRELTDVQGRPVALPQDGVLVHLQFRRFAGCPICNLHLRSFVQRHAELEAAGIREVVVFHSPVEELQGYDLPFAVIPDPTKALYREFGVETSRRALLDPAVWPHIVRAILRSTWMILRRKERGPSNSPAGGRLGLPADFLIAPDGAILASKHGEHAYDQWSVDEVLSKGKGS
jgi:peroxiredoxin